MLNDIELSQIILNGIKEAVRLGKEPAFIYDRVSTSEQEKSGNSLDYQEINSLRYVNHNNLYPVHFFTLSETGYKSENRKTFINMLRLSEKFNINHIVFKNSDRLSRNLKDLLKIQESIEKHNLTVHFFEGGKPISKDSTYDEKWILELLILVAKRHSDKLSHDIKASNRFRVEKGIAPGRSPVGYIWDKEKKIHLIDSNLKNSFNFIFDEFDTFKYSISEMMDLLNEKRILNSSGRKWKKSMLHYTLTNPFYCGDFYYQEKVYPGIQEAYFSKDRFNKRLEFLGENHVGKKKNDHKFILSKMLKCPDCGCTLTGDIKKDKYIYYMHRCQANDKPTGKYLSENKIIEMFDKEIKSIEMSDEFSGWLKELFLKTYEYKDNEKVQSISVISRKISEFEIEIDNLFELFSKSSIDSELLEKRINKCQKEIKSVQRQLKLSLNDNYNSHKTLPLKPKLTL